MSYSITYKNLLKIQTYGDMPSLIVLSSKYRISSRFLEFAELGCNNRADLGAHVPHLRPEILQDASEDSEG